MGAVFLAEQIAVGNRPVALKVLSRKLLDDPEFLLRFQNEAASTGRIHHPNVVTIYESGQVDDGTPYIAMEFLEGESLRRALARRGQLPVPEVAEILQQAARGLNAAHKLGIIHRDLKPDNIFLTYPDDAAAPLVGAHDVGAGLVPALPVGIADTGRAQDPPLRPLVVKVVDFGIAKLRESGAHTQTGMVLGTPAYMSFEQASGMKSDELDARSDVYSLGVVVYEMLTGRTPFHSDTPVGYLRKHMQEDPPPFRAVKTDLPGLPQLESVVMKALTKDRNQRYGSVLEFAQELNSAAQPLPADQSPVTFPPTRTVPAPTLAKPQHLPVVPKYAIKFLVLGAVLLAIIAAAIWYFPRWGGQPPAHATSPSSGATVRAGQKPSVEAPRAEVAPTPGTAKVNPKDGLKYIWIPPGTYQMGCSPGDTECDDGEKPPHQVTLTKGFWLGQTEVTVTAYKRFTRSTGKAMPKTPSSNPDWSNGQMPIVNVNWDDAQAYCAWAGGRLPTDAEWEYAARAGSTQARYGHLDEIAWYISNSGDQAHVVAQKRANGFGLFDMLGNVWQWVNDWYGEDYYQSSPSRDPAGPTSGPLRVIRGGSWDSPPNWVRVSGRMMGFGYPLNIGDNKGVRCVGEMFAPSAPEKETSRPGVSPPAAGRVKENPRDRLKYDWIPPGTFMMGCSPGDDACTDDEKPPHQVTITKGFWLGQTEVTVAAYKRFTAATGRRMPPEPDIYGRPLNPGWRDDAMPIVDVTWDDAQAYCRWAGGRLPTEAEWEYAARAGSAEARYGSPDKVAWDSENSRKQTHPVGEKQANGFRLYDMLGNVWEWVNDWYDDSYYRSSPSQDPAGPASGELHVLRGGSWIDSSREVRVSIRSRIINDAGFDSTSGFRCGGEGFPP
jgi:formylglycine-generating enzyme required for sulfatase activity/serine/threonine protein kinase